MPPGFRQFLRFALVGVAGTLAQYGVLFVGADLLGASATWSSALGYLLGSVVNYLLNYYFTFASSKSHLEAASKFYVIAGSGWVINTGLMALFAGYWGWHHWLAQLLVTGLCLLWNFAGSKLWAFRHPATQQ
ncbi:GtrA family protein [Chitinilyticum litopenaei]|uniref:GtrA family protein n=2 Tax=Chitinilyticum piscinae TaxID=2866724 RepID=A0A8J7FM14_9NEIS|nr:GtrA family protein [Chitinilyticum piscinae]